MIFTNQNNGLAQHLAENHILHLSGLQCIWNQHLLIITPADDINPLARKFINDVLNSITTNTNTGPNAINPLVVAAHCHLAAVSRFAGYVFNFDDAFGNFRNFLFEKSLNQMCANSTENHFYATPHFTDFKNRCSHPFICVVDFTGNLFTTRQNSFNIRKRNCRCATFITLDHAGHHLPGHIIIFLVECVPLSLPNLLDNHLLCCLRTDPTNRLLRVKRLTIVRAGDCPRFTVNLNHDLFIFAIMFVGSGHQRLLYGLKDDFWIDILIAMDRINDT